MTDMSSVASRILLTLAYSDQFEYPLTLRELYIRYCSSQGTHVSKETFAQAIGTVYRKKLIHFSQGFWSTRSLRETEQLVQVRQARQHFSKQKLLESEQFIGILSRHPWVSGIAITGSTAVSSADADDDLDFMIVTKSRRLWLVRVLVVLLSLIAGKRRTWQKEEPNSWCFNLWLEETQLALPLEKRSVYTAYEVLQTSWAGVPTRTATHFYKSNSWVRKFIPHWKVRSPEVKTHFSFFEWLEAVLSPLWDALNVCAYLVQLAYMQRHKTREHVGFSYAFFHPRDTKQSLMTGWKERIAAQF